MPWPQHSASILDRKWPTWAQSSQIASTSCANQKMPQNGSKPSSFTSTNANVQNGDQPNHSTHKNSYFAIPHQQFSPKFAFLLIFFILFIFHPSFANSAQPRPSCREHFLNGNAEDGVFPILSPSGLIFWLECRFPPSGSQSARLSVQTVVNNAVVGQWIGAELAQNLPNGIHVQMQVMDRDFLHQMMEDSDECSQKIHIKWPSLLLEERNESESGGEILFAESFTGQKLQFRRNSSIHVSHEEILSIHKGPIVRIDLSFPAGASIALGPLICRQTIIPRHECKFEMRSDSDRIRLKLPLLRRKAVTESANTVSISFRTGKPSARLLELLDGGHGPLGAMDLIDGYLLFANHITYPAKLLADGLWHTLHLDLHSLSIRVDDLGTSLSMRAAANDGEPLWLDVLAQGEVAAIRLDSQDGNRPREWICEQETDLMDIRQSMPQQHIFARPLVCSTSADEVNFCNCQGPNSALSQNGGIGRQARSVAQCSAIPADENALHLSRLADRLAFLIVPNFGQKMPISILFKSEAQTGLIFFGHYSIQSTSALPKAMLAPNGGRELGGRVQVHFVGNQIFGAICSQLADGSEKCFSCSIQMDKGFADSDKWQRISLFYQLNQQFLSANNKVCLLSPNAHVVDPAELYRITATNVLLVGGAFYAKHPILSQQVSNQFRRQFQDNTREKAPSLLGCIGEIMLRGQRQNLSQLLADQMQKAQPAENNGNDGNIFSVKVGCPQCPSKCNGASCSRQWTTAPFERQDPICQCSGIYSATKNGECQIMDQKSSKLEYGNEGGMKTGIQIEDDNIETPTLEIPIFGTTTLTRGLQGRRQLDRIWLLMRLPEVNEQMRPFIGIGSLQISVGQNGHRLVVESKEFGLLEEFLLPHQLDGRLHLLSIQRNPEIGTGANGHSLTIRLDNAHRRVHLEEILSLISLDGSPPKIQIRPIPLENSEEGEIEPFGGCIEELIFNFAPIGEALSTMAYGFMPIEQQQNAQEVDYIGQFREQFPRQFANINSADGIQRKCGIRDPTLWAGNASSWGRIGQGDEQIGGGGPIGYILKKGSSLPRISLLITAALVLVILVALTIYMFYAIKRHYSNQNGGPMTNKGGGKNHFDELTANDHEKRPLKLQMEEEQHTDNGSSSSNAGGGNNGTTKQPNGNVGKYSSSDIDAPPRPPKSPKGHQMPDYVIVNGSGKIKEPLSIQPLDGSPKPIGGNGCGLRVTPLRSQPLRNGTSGRFVIQSPLANQRAQFFTNNSSQSPQNDRLKISPIPSTNGSKMNYHRDQPHQWSSNGSGSAGFFSPSPTSATSSTSPGSNSLQGSNNNDLRRSPHVRVAATSRQHSPIGTAAPIVCQEEL